MLKTFDKMIQCSRINAVIILAINLFAKLLISLKIVPYSVQYISDILLIVNVVMALSIFFKCSNELKRAVLYLFLPVVVFFLVEIISALINGFDILLLSWHLRNYYRIFAYVFILGICFEKLAIEKIFKVLYWILILHTILVVIQLLDFYFEFEGHFWHQDYVNGIFGNIKGYNTYSLVFILIVSGYYLCRFVICDEMKNKAVISFALSALVAAVSELKLYYYLILVFLGVLFFVKLFKGNIRKLLINYLKFGIIIVCSYFVMGFLYPYVFGFFFDSENIREYTAKISYGSEQVTTVDIETDDSNEISDEKNNAENGEEQEIKNTIPKVNRLSAITIIPEYCFENAKDYFWGIGSGNAEYSQNSRLCGEEYHKYGETGYNKFTYAMLLLETGFLGVVAYALIFLVWLIRFGLLFLKEKGCDKAIYFFCAFMSFVSLIDIVYDAALRSEASYFYGFAISIGMITCLDKFKIESKSKKPSKQGKVI